MPNLMSPQRPTVSSLNEVLSILQLVSSPKAVKAVVEDILKEQDALHALVAEQAVQQIDIAKREAELADAQIKLDAKAQSVAADKAYAESLRTEYEGKLGTLRGLLK